MTLTFTVLGMARPQGSLRAFQPKGLRFPVLTSMAKGLKEWKQSIAGAAAEALVGSRMQPFSNGPVTVDVTFYLPRPKKFLTKKFKAIDVPLLTTPDTDKLARAALDGLTNVVWHDDSQVTDLIARKRYCAAGEMPRAEITVTAVAVAPVPTKAPVRRPTLLGQEDLYAHTSLG